MEEDPQDREEAWPQDSQPPRKRGAEHYAVLTGLTLANLGIASFALFLKADARGFGTHEQLGLRPCQLLKHTGVPCPGCGVSTAVTLAAQGRPLQAFMTQPLGPLLVLMMPLLLIWSLRAHLQGEDLYDCFAKRRWPWVRVIIAFTLAAWFFKLNLFS